MTPVGHAISYKVPEQAEFLWEHWDDESVLFDPRSGESHLLKSLAAEALLILQEKPLNAAQLTRTLRTLFDISPDQLKNEHIDNLLQQFEEIGLVERCCPR